MMFPRDFSSFFGLGGDWGDFMQKAVSCGVPIHP